MSRLRCSTQDGVLRRFVRTKRARLTWCGPIMFSRHRISHYVETDGGDQKERHDDRPVEVMRRRVAHPTIHCERESSAQHAPKTVHQMQYSHASPHSRPGAVLFGCFVKTGSH